MLVTAFLFRRRLHSMICHSSVQNPASKTFIQWQKMTEIVATIMECTTWAACPSSHCWRTLRRIAMMPWPPRNRYRRQLKEKKGDGLRRAMACGAAAQGPAAAPAAPSKASENGAAPVVVVDDDPGLTYSKYMQNYTCRHCLWTLKGFLTFIA